MRTPPGTSVRRGAASLRAVGALFIRRGRQGDAQPCAGFCNRRCQMALLRAMATYLDRSSWPWLASQPQEKTAA